MDMVLHIPDSLAKELEGIPNKQRQSYVVGAIRERIEREKAKHEAWIAKEIQAGVEEADRGEFVPDDEMRKFFIECGVNVKD